MFLKKLICICIALVLSTSFALATEYSNDGLDVKIEERKIDKTVYHIAHVTITDPSQFKTALAGPSDANLEATVVDMAKVNKATIAINGDYYTNRTTGLIIRNGEEVRIKPTDRYDLLIVDNNADFHIIENSNSKELKKYVKQDLGMMHVFSFGPGLVRNGKMMKISTKYSFAPQDSTAPRTAIGQLGPLNYVLVVADGRQSGYSRGASHKMMAELMLELGCITAYNLDGGGSSAMVFQGNLISKPPKDVLRNISDIIYFVPQGEVKWCIVFI